MTRPNFFIVGAPKCGTSALWKYLRCHPQIIMSSNKEPHFFATDLPKYRAVDTMEAYLGLFAAENEQTRAVGEASVFHMFSSTAIPNIRRFEPNAKLIAMVRNPIELAYSFHAQLVFSREENKDFPTALKLLGDRARGKHVPRLAREPALLQYLRIAMLGEQVERMLSIFPRDQVKVLIFDDFRADTHKSYEEVLSFLDVPSDGRTEFPVHNASKKHRIGWVGTLAHKPPKFFSRAAGMVKRVVGIRELGLMNRIKRMNRVEGEREPLPPAVMRELTDVFRDDIRKLSRLIGRDMSHWLDAPASSIKPGSHSLFPSA